MTTTHVIARVAAHPLGDWHPASQWCWDHWGGDGTWGYGTASLSVIHDDQPPRELVAYAVNMDGVEQLREFQAYCAREDPTAVWCVL